MSRNTSPRHGFSGAFDNFYDPDFTVQISSKMQVPDKISVIEGVESKEKVSIPRESEKMLMHVPDRILVAGGNEHVEDRDPLPEVRLESAMLSHPVPGIALQAPPRVLTLDECSYPSVDEKPPGLAKKKSDASPQAKNEITYTQDNSVNNTHPAEDEVTLLRMQVKLLGRRIATVERDNQLRQQREIILYSAGVLYFLLKGMLWLHRHF